MMTARQIEKWWSAGEYPKLARQCLAGRAESVEALRGNLESSTAAAALALIRLDELGQTSPIVPALVRAVSLGQHDDGGWQDPLITALCVRALLTQRQEHPRATGGIAWLARLQRDDGGWPQTPLRRMSGDVVTTAFVLLQLVPDRTFRATVRVRDAVRWLNEYARSLEAEEASLVRAALLRATARIPLSPVGSTRLQAA